MRTPSSPSPRQSVPDTDPPRLVLGIDAGGTHTVGILADESGTVRGRSRAGGANLHVHGEAGVERSLRQLIAGLECDEPISAVCLGIAGADRPDELQTLRDLLLRLGLPATCRVVHDAEIALVAGAPERHGVVLIAGTGSIAFGVDPAGRRARSGGWGFLLGDEGSAVWLGRVALRSTVRAVDGRGPSTLLSEKISRHLGLEIPSGLVAWVHGEQALRHRVAEVVPMVQAAFDEGDAVAIEMVEEASRHLTNAVRAVVRQLRLASDFPLVLSGGAFFACPSLVAGVERQLELPGARVARLEDDPAMGAVALALDLLPARAVS